MPLYPFSGSGEHLVLLVRKKGLTTLQMLKEFSNIVGVKSQDIGYAGLKDKEGMTTQYISMPAKFEEQLVSFTHPDIKILNTTKHNNKIKIGHLLGNRFFIRLKKVNPVDALKLSEAVKKIASEGMPNYFGYQRFGNDKDNHITGQEIISGTRKERNPKLKKLFINAYQSHLFNCWLSRRVELSRLINEFSAEELSKNGLLSFELIKELQAQPQFFKIFKGDIVCHYPLGRNFIATEPLEEAHRFMQKDVCVTGLLAGAKTMRATDDARLIEAEFDDESIKEFGDRRFAWIFVQNLTYKHIAEEAQFELSFELPKGCYATTLLEELAQKELRELQSSD